MTPCTALVPLSPFSCPDCGGLLVLSTVVEPALLIHGGYGGARETVRRWCPCGWMLTARVGEVRPPDRGQDRGQPGGQKPPR